MVNDNENSTKKSTNTQPSQTAESEMAKSDSQRAAEQADALADRVPTTEQSARENAGNTRGPWDGDSGLGISDTIHGVPSDQRAQKHHDSTHRGDHEIQGETVPTTGNERDRRTEETKL